MTQQGTKSQRVSAFSLPFVAPFFKFLNIFLNCQFYTIFVPTFIFSNPPFSFHFPELSKSQLFVPLLTFSDRQQLNWFSSSSVDNSSVKNGEETDR